MNGYQIKEFKENMLKDICPYLPTVKSEIEKIVNQTTIEVISKEQMNEYGGEGELICYMGNICYLTEDFFELSFQHQRIMFFADFCHMFELI